MDRLFRLHKYNLNQIAIFAMYTCSIIMASASLLLNNEYQLYYGISATTIIICVFLYSILTNKELLHVVLRPVAVLLLTIFNRIEVQGRENLPEHGAFILAGNHTGLLDAIIVSVASKRPVGFIMTNEIFSWPYVGKIVGFFNVIPVVPGKGSDSINKGVEQLNNGKVMCIFPEGRCTEDGKLGRFHLGVSRLHTKSNAPLIPFAIEGGFEAWPIAGMPKPHKIIVKIGKTIETNGLKEKEILDLLKNSIQELKTDLESAKKTTKFNLIINTQKDETLVA